MRQMRSGVHMLRHHACVQPRRPPDAVESGDGHYGRAAVRTLMFACLLAHDVTYCTCARPGWLLLCFALPCWAEKERCRPVGQPKSRLPLLGLLKRDEATQALLCSLRRYSSNVIPHAGPATTTATHPFLLHVQLSPFLLLAAFSLCVLASRH